VGDRGLQCVTKERAQAIALELFSVNGYDGTSMRMIAEELGVSKAALYYHFAGKEDIVRGIIATFLTKVDSVTDWAVTDPRPSPEEVLRRWADLMRTDALRLMRFMQANHRIVRDIKPPGGSVRERMESLSESLAPPGAPLEAKVRARLALFSLQGPA